MITNLALLGCNVVIDVSSEIFFILVAKFTKPRNILNVSNSKDGSSKLIWVKFNFLRSIIEDYFRI